MPRQTARTLATAAAATAIAGASPAAMATSQASSYIAAPAGAQHSDDVDIGQAPDRVLKSTGDASKSLSRPQIEKIVDSPMDDDWLSNMAFMNEMIDIQVPETDDPQAEQIFEININGRPFVFGRGEVKTVPRYVADHMLRMKRTGYQQKETHNAEGIKDIVHNARTSLKYPLMIARDNNPMGRDWFKFTASLRG